MCILKQFQEEETPSTLAVLAPDFLLAEFRFVGVQSVSVTLYPHLSLQGSQLSMRSRFEEQLFSPSTACLSFLVEYRQLEYLTLIKASATIARYLERGSLGTQLRLSGQLSLLSSFSMVIMNCARKLGLYVWIPSRNCRIDVV